MILQFTYYLVPRSQPDQNTLLVHYTLQCNAKCATQSKMTDQSMENELSIFTWHFLSEICCSVGRMVGNQK